DLVMPGDLLGYVTPEASEHTGIPAGVPVIATANDKAVEALGCGLRSPGSLLVSLGTYIASMSVGQQNVAGTRQFWVNFACAPHEYLYESHGVRRGMWTVTWWRDLMGEEARGRAARRGLGVEEYLDSEAGGLPPGSDGLMVVLDWLAPADAPFRKGSMLGFDVRHGPAHVHRAVLEGIALTIYRCANAMAAELGVSHDDLVISGGGSGSDLFMQIFADVFGIPARRARVNSSAGLGAAICAAVGTGLYGGWDEAVHNMVSWGEPFTPDSGNHDVYLRAAAIYDQIPALTDKIFRQSYEIFG
ncbi:MAG TPA: FGGY-family carbohydrate kinase, partial [Acidimicrobiales bacterium]|nr:FGGY-family carbohydrate kinase [Acidimicrobiales bacterium]